jgi:hypothetical protein
MGEGTASRYAIIVGRMAPSEHLRSRTISLAWLKSRCFHFEPPPLM